MRLTPALAFLAAASLVATPSLAGKNGAKSKITTAEVEAAQKGWSDSLLEIAKAEREGRDPRPLAEAHIKKFYAYELGTVLFKPTVASVDQFRGSPDEALSYFVKGSNPEDKGFALIPWTNVRWENEGVVTDKDSAMAMGNYFFTKADNTVTKVEYSFGYLRAKDGSLKINLHHSSLPYVPPAAQPAADAKAKK